jgi:hypothetical protein
VDQVLFLPAILSCFFLASKQKTLVLSALNLLAAVVVLRQESLSSPVFLWMAPAWMLWCLWARAGDSRDTSPEPAIQPA